MGLVKTRRLAAMQKQQRAKAGTGSVANGGGLPVLPISNWGLKLDIGNTGDTGNIIPSAVPPQGLLPAKPLAPKPVFIPTIARYVTYSNT